MTDSVFKRLKKARKDWTRSLGEDIETPSGRRLAWVHFNLIDHAYLRHLWTNRYEIAPGVFRSNQPGPARVRAEARRGIRTIISLRGNTGGSFRLFEMEAAEEVGIQMEFARLSASNLLPAEEYIALLDLFKSVERPMLMHCKSGADRAGLASAMYLIAEEGAPFDEAARQLHWKYMHRRSSKRKGILYFMLQRYAADTANGAMFLRDWFATRYDPEAITADYRRSRGMKPK